MFGWFENIFKEKEEPLTDYQKYLWTERAMKGHLAQNYYIMKLYIKIEEKGLIIEIENKKMEVRNAKDQSLVYDTETRNGTFYFLDSADRFTILTTIYDILQNSKENPREKFEEIQESIKTNLPGVFGEGDQND